MREKNTATDKLPPIGHTVNLSLSENSLFQLKTSPDRHNENQPTKMLFNEVSGSARFQPDLMAFLHCQKNEGTWDLFLTEFIPGPYCELIDRNIDRNIKIDINEFIPKEMQRVHRNWVNSILSEGRNSPHWKKLVDLMSKNRYIAIQRPFDANTKTHQVAIVMNLLEEGDTRYVFEIQFYDNSKEYSAACLAATVTHNLRGPLSSIIRESELINEKLSDEDDLIKLATENPSQFRKIIGEIRQSADTVKQLGEHGLTTCAPKLASFLPQNQQVQIEAKFEDVNLILGKYAREYLTFVNEKIKSNQVRLTYRTTNQLFLDALKINPLKELVYNIVKNAVDAGAKEICIEASQDGENYQCDIIDDGPGLSPALKTQFFDRRLSQEYKKLVELSDITANRGEGSVISFQTWSQVGGSAMSMERSDGKQGTIFRLLTSGHPPSNGLTKQHIDFMNSKKKDLKGTILLVDDVLMYIKILVRHLIEDPGIREIAFKNFQWTSNSLHLIYHQAWVIACAANPEIAYQFAWYYHPVFIMSDHELNASKTGAEFLISVGQTIKPCPILAIHSSDDQEAFIGSESINPVYPALKSLNVTFIRKGASDLNTSLRLLLSPIGYFSSKNTPKSSAVELKPGLCEVLQNSPN